MEADALIVSKKKSPGRPRTQPLDKSEYNKQRYQKQRERLSEINTKNNSKYRESFKVIKQLSEPDIISLLPVSIQEQIKHLIEI
jgi:hypothetical protein